MAGDLGRMLTRRGHGSSEPFPHTVIGGSAVLGVPKGKEFPKASMGGWGFLESFIEDEKLRGFPPMSHLHLSHHGISPILSSAGLELRSLPRISASY